MTQPDPQTTATAAMIVVVVVMVMVVVVVLAVAAGHALILPGGTGRHAAGRHGPPHAVTDVCRSWRPGNLCACGSDD
jgi:hypothetical protein